MASALIYLVVVLAVAAVVYLLAAVVFGRGEQLEALPPGATPTRLPQSDIEASDVRALRFQQVFRGYKASEVDWALERVAGEVDELRGRVATLERQLDLAGEQLRQEHEQASAADPEESPASQQSPTSQQSAASQQARAGQEFSASQQFPTQQLSSQQQFPGQQGSLGEQE